MATKGPKNIVICCDGTGNEFGLTNSNVVKLYTALRINNEQVGYYHPGVGTMGAPQARSWIEKKLSMMNGLAFASGFLDNVEDAYRYLMATYADGDHIYLIGFSRGAYTVRALAAILHAYGLLCRGNESHIPYVLRMFQDEMKAARHEARHHRMHRTGKKKTYISQDLAFKQTFSHDVILHFVGIWDTVSSVGWITQPFRLLYSAQNPIMQTGRHAVSIDERRCSFQDNLWGPALSMHETPTLGKKTTQEDGKTSFEPLPQDILQVWFAGVHSDVGGSYLQLESALSNGALEWLLDEARAHGLVVEEDRVELIFGRPTKKEYAAAPLFVAPIEPGIVHRSLWGPWWLLEVLPHRAYVMDDDKEEWRIPLGSPRRVPSGAIVHPSVFTRMRNQAADYHPSNLHISTLKRCPPAEAGIVADLSKFYRHEPGGTKTNQRQISARTVLGVVAFVTTFLGVLLKQRSGRKQLQEEHVPVLGLASESRPVFHES